MLNQTRHSTTSLKRVQADGLLHRSRTTAARQRRPDVHRSYLIPVLAKAFTVIQLLEDAKTPMSAEQVHAATGFSKTTVCRILRTLSAYGYMPRGDEGVYSPPSGGNEKQERRSSEVGLVRRMA